MARILIDALGIDQPGGARTAVLEPLTRLVAQRPEWQFIVALSAREPRLEGCPNVRQLVLPARKGVRARLLAQTVLPIVVRRFQIDLAHFAKSQAAVVPSATVMTIFDTTTLSRPELHSKLAVWYWRTVQPRMARRARAVTTLSHHAAAEIERWLGVPAAQIEVIPCASRFTRPPDPLLLAQVRRRHDLPARYLLAVGILARWKNFETLIEALALLRAEGRPVPPLVLVGPRYPQSDGSALFSRIAGRGLADSVRYLGPVPDEELPALFAGCELYLAPSLNEGFGITCLEAMSCGAPVIAARVSATPEVVGEAGLLVDDPRSPRAWAAAIAQLLGDEGERGRLRAAGIARAASFRWEDAAARYLAIYERLLGAPALLKAQ
ncbi:MAG: glycosyltransferase family 1 protein [Chloroflexota bacterium]|nr:glycosyltransferase family 4 protein [Dehalococcoidia bacterium]MDW8254148.1 glycosyltransferase family 1 protein [Chloroflexota bacterium]